MTKLLTMGVIGTSRKENEKRVAIHPEHLTCIPDHIRKQLTFEKGYGKRFDVTDYTLAKLSSGRVVSRKEILSSFDCVVLPKPIAEDMAEIRQGATVWGWPHCVQQKEITQISIDRKLTLIAWEEMFTWSPNGDKSMHVFYKNNEFAGYAGVNHALSLTGLNGYYGKRLKVVVFSFGSASRGAVYALQGQGFKDIIVYTSRPTTEVRDQLPGITFKQMMANTDDHLLEVNTDNSTRPLIEALAEADIIINGTLQDTDKPKLFVSQPEAARLKKGTLIIDVSCDEGMGFWCARPTSFENPMFDAEHIHYYAVDHSPSYYWNSATWEISKALLPFIPKILCGPEVWNQNYTLAKSIEIRKGMIQNPKILSFQKRRKEYPHLLLN